MTAVRTSDGSHWPTILLIVDAGVVSAFQAGKAPMALAAVQADLGLDIDRCGGANAGPRSCLCDVGHF